MKFTFNWLKAHLDTDASISEIGDALTAVGLEVESITDPAAALDGFVVAEIRDAAPHPDADKLQVCQVDAGDGAKPAQVVCGAPNARAGLKGVFAPPGAYVPGLDMKLGAAKIRGVESHGMMCSARELELGDDHAGIIELDTDLPAGASAAEALGLTDPVIEIAITPNRGDCLGVHGIARDLAAAGVGTLRPLLPASVPSGAGDGIGVAIDLPADARNACPHFVARTIRGVRNRESPDWLKRYLLAVGLRPISALVDITNYFSIDRCRPLHVFDADTVAGDLVVRLSRQGDRLSALDGRNYDLGDGACVISDDDGVLSLGGIMGGESSSCTETTTNIVLESAYFDPLRTALTGRRLGIDSDARYRFERGIDPDSTAPAMEAATRMILDICGGEACLPAVAGASPDTTRSFVFNVGLVARRGGLDIPESQARDILLGLGFNAKPDIGGLRVTVPSWRHDIDGPADLVEEVLRIHGYDAIPAVPLSRPATLSKPVATRTQRRSGLAKRGLAARGMMETVTFSFIGRQQAELFGGGAPELRLENPISSEMTDMRPSMLPALVEAAGRNAARGMADVRLFEVGPVYSGVTPDGQSLMAAGIRAGMTGPRHWAEAPRPVDAFDAKADALAALSECQAPVASLQTGTGAPSWFHPGRSGTLQLGSNVLARFGELHPGLLAQMDVAGPVVGFEVMLDAIPEPRGRPGKGRGVPDLSPLQPVERDFAFLVDADVTAESLLRAVRGADRKLIADAAVFDVYTGAGVPEGKVSLAVSVTLQPRQATLTDAEIEAVSAKVTSAAQKAVGASLRQ